MTVVERETELYQDVWSAIDAYGQHSPGEHLVSMFLDMAGLESGRGCTLLDAGCGSGKGAVALHRLGFDVLLCDLTDAGLVDDAKGLRFSPACLWDDLPSQLPALFGGKADYVYCCDVLEHVPPEFTMLVLHRLLAVTRVGLFLNISLVPDAFGAFVGQPLHQTVQPFVWWRDRLRDLGASVACRDLISSGVYYVRPR